MEGVVNNNITSIEESINAIVTFPLSKFENPKYNNKFPDLTKWVIESFIDNQKSITDVHPVAVWLLEAGPMEEIPADRYTEVFLEDYKKIFHKLRHSAKYVYKFIREIISLYYYYNIAVEPMVFIKSIGVMMHQQWLIDITDNAMIKVMIEDTVSNNLHTDENNESYYKPENNEVEEVIKEIEENNELLKEIEKITKENNMENLRYNKIDLEKDIKEIEESLKDPNLPEETKELLNYSLNVAKGEFGTIIEKCKEIEIELYNKGELEGLTPEEIALKVAIAATKDDASNTSTEEDKGNTVQGDDESNTTNLNKEKDMLETKIADAKNKIDEMAASIDEATESAVNGLEEAVNDLKEAVEKTPKSVWKKVLCVAGVIAAGVAGYAAYKHFTNKSVLDTVAETVEEVTE